MFKKVAIGISGGVDSAVAALILKQRGYNVHGVFMQNWDLRDEKGVCSSEEDYKDAQFVCEKLNIRLHYANFVKEYWNEVFTKLVQEYELGFTPNPDILCNRNIKFDYFYKFALEKLNADAIATGHYAKTSFGPYLDDYQLHKNVKLLLAKDKRKDQTFFLCQINQEPLRKTMFPLCDITKSEVKHMAMDHGLEKIAAKPESMGICFIGSRNFQSFIQEYISDKPGNFVDIDSGKVVGQHKGFHQWTLGQRTKLAGLPMAYFIARKDVENNILYVAQGTNHPILNTDLFFTHKPHWICEYPRELESGEIYECQFKFQHTQGWLPCQVCETKRGLMVQLFEGIRAITGGQYAVFEKNGECLGSAKIANSGVSKFSIGYSNENVIQGHTVEENKNEAEIYGNISFQSELI